MILTYLVSKSSIRATELKGELIKVTWSCNHTIKQSNDHAFTHSNNQTTMHSYNQTIKQSCIHTITQSCNHTIKQSNNHAFTKNVPFGLIATCEVSDVCHQAGKCSKALRKIAWSHNQACMWHFGRFWPISIGFNCGLRKLPDHTIMRSHKDITMLNFGTIWQILIWRVQFCKWLDYHTIKQPHNHKITQSNNHAFTKFVPFRLISTCEVSDECHHAGKFNRALRKIIWSHNQAYMWHFGKFLLILIGMNCGLIKLPAHTIRQSHNDITMLHFSTIYQILISHVSESMYVIL